MCFPFPVAFFLLLSSPMPLSDPNCPLDFTSLGWMQPIDQTWYQTRTALCDTLTQGLRLVLADYLHRTSNFYPPMDTLEACWNEYQRQLGYSLEDFDIRKLCAINTRALGVGCSNITTASEFREVVPPTILKNLTIGCSASLAEEEQCVMCGNAVTDAAFFFRENGLISYQAISHCSFLPGIYSAGIVNGLGPRDPGTAKCLLGFRKVDKETLVHQYDDKIMSWEFVNVCIVCAVGYLIFAVAFARTFIFPGPRQEGRHED